MPSRNQADPCHMTSYAGSMSLFDHDMDESDYISNKKPDDAVSLNCNKTAVDQFSEAYEMEYIQSELILANQFVFCGLCLSERQGVHKANCMTQQQANRDAASAKTNDTLLEAQQFLTVNVFKHMPPRVDGCLLEDSQCAACQLAQSPSMSFWTVNLCEKDLLGSSSAASVLNEDDDLAISSSFCPYDLDQVAYCVEMSEDTSKMQCQR